MFEFDKHITYKNAIVSVIWFNHLILNTCDNSRKINKLITDNEDFMK